MSQNDPVNKSTQNVSGKLSAGVRWTGMSQVLQQIINLGCSVILARLLAPDDFGLLAMASVFTGIVFFVLDLGLNAVIVQRQNIEEQQISSIFWINVGLGLFMTLIGFASSWAIADFYNSPGVQPIVALLSCNFLVSSLSRTQAAVLTRRMEFRSLEFRTLAGLIVGSTCAVALAFYGFGVWSLVGRILVTGAVETIMLWSVSGWRPSFWFRWSDVQDLIGFSNDVLIANLLRYFGRNADNLLIGKFVGVTELGFYALAYNLMMLPVLRFSQVLAGVLFPALSRLQEDLEKLKQSWFRASRTLAAFTVPLMLGLIVLAPQFVHVVYGQKWLPVVPLLQVLTMSGIFQSLGLLNSTVLLALGETQLRLKLTFYSVGLAVVAFLVGLPYGAFGVASCFAVMNIATETFFLIKTLECVGSSYVQYMRNLSSVVTAAIVMSLVLLALGLNLQLTSSAILAIAIPVGIAVYLILLNFLAPKILTEILSILPKRFTKSWLKVG
jgi:O-antigen/teichoic acid export membrane protein